MGKRVKKNNQWVYQQETGEITAWFAQMEEKMSLIHKGQAQYRLAFYILVGAGALYLAVLFAFVH